MRLAELEILDIWSALGGGALRGNRGKAFWRDGDGYSIALEPAKVTWFDFRDARGGGVLALVETALGCDRRSALQWLETNCGLDSSQPRAIAERRNYRRELDDAEHFSIAAQALAEQELDGLDANDPGRADYTQLLGIIRTGGQALIEEYRAWRTIHPELTEAMERAGMYSQARVQRRLALYLLEFANAA